MSRREGRIHLLLMLLLLLAKEAALHWLRLHEGHMLLRMLLWRLRRLFRFHDHNVGNALRFPTRIAGDDHVLAAIGVIDLLENQLTGRSHLLQGVASRSKDFLHRTVVLEPGDGRFRRSADFSVQNNSTTTTDTLRLQTATEHWWKDRFLDDQIGSGG